MEQEAMPTLRPIAEIKPYPKNAKVHTEKQIKKIADSIAEFGFNQPIVVDRDNVIIVGHGRYLAAQLLGRDPVPVIKVPLDEERARAYRLADNKLNESDWEMDLVIEELKALSLPMIDLTGFDADLVLETKEDEPNIGLIGVPKTQAGDVYDLGPHRLICGDSESEDTYKKLLGEDKARLIFTDPPYAVDYIPAGGLDYSNEEGKILNDDKTPSEALDFFKKILRHIYTFSTNDVNLYWWFASRLTDLNQQSWRETGWHMSQICIWLKNSLVYSVGQNFHRIYEPCMVGWKQGFSRYRDPSFPKYTELWTLEGKSFADYLDMWYQKRDNTSKYIHPTQKPVQLAERAIKRSSEKGDIVLDAFGGSGSTMIACAQLGRRARLIELDPKYCDAIVTRWTQFSENTHVIKNGEEILW